MRKAVRCLRAQNTGRKTAYPFAKTMRKTIRCPRTQNTGQTAANPFAKTMRKAARCLRAQKTGRTAADPFAKTMRKPVRCLRAQNTEQPLAKRMARLFRPFRKGKFAANSTETGKNRWRNGWQRCFIRFARGNSPQTATKPAKLTSETDGKAVSSVSHGGNRRRPDN